MQRSNLANVDRDCHVSYRDLEARLSLRTPWVLGSRPGKGAAMKAWLGVGSLVLFATLAHGTTVLPPPSFEEVKKSASFIGVIEVVEIPQEPATGYFGDKPPTVAVKIVESWQGPATNTSHGFLWDAEFRPESITSYYSGIPLPDLAAERISMPTKGERYLVFAETRPGGVWRDIYGWRRRPVVQELPAGHPDGKPVSSWWSWSFHCLRAPSLEEIGQTRNFYGRQKFSYASEPDDARTKGALRWTDVTERGEYWVLSGNTAVKMTVTAIQRNPAWPVRYTIQKGDSLALIANRFYDNEARWKNIAKANNIKDATKIKSGMVLTIPPVRDDK